jgi:RNA-directed DNA polymerase
LWTALARSILAGDPAIELVVSRLTQTLGRKWRWLSPLARRYAENFTGNARPRRRDVEEFLRGDPGLTRAIEKYRNEISVKTWLVEAPSMLPVAAAKAWRIPAIESVRDLAEWLHLSESELEWFADLKGLQSKPNPQGTGSKLTHYYYRTLAKNSGSLRLIEEPKPHLKQIQRQILSDILDRIPIHPAAHGFVKGRSIQTFAAPHVARRVVLRMDLQDFFPSFAARRIQAFFRTAGYPESVADLLGGLCTNAAPRSIWKDLEPDTDSSLVRYVQTLYSRPHLPQGAPTSPALANVCTYRIDCRLSGLAQAAGAAYTRYADDLAFSGDESFEKCVERFSVHAAAILLEEGFAVHHRKTRIMRQGVRQYLAGLVANQRVNVVRADFDRLKATLHNCAQNGPQSENREAHPCFRSHLEGRVGFVETINPEKGRRLRQILERIQW